MPNSYIVQPVYKALQVLRCLGDERRELALERDLLPRRSAEDHGLSLSPDPMRLRLRHTRPRHRSLPDWAARLGAWAIGP